MKVIPSLVFSIFLLLIHNNNQVLKCKKSGRWCQLQGTDARLTKGKRNEDVQKAVTGYGAVYMAAVGGAGALLSKCIKEAEVIAYDDLGTEAIRRLRVENLPVIVILDSVGGNMYESAVEEFLKS